MELHLSPRATRQGMTVSVAEAAVYTVWFSLIGNNFLTGYLVLMGASNAQIGLTASLLPLSSLMQLLSAYVMAHLPRRRPYMMLLAYLHRIFYTLGGFVPLFLPHGSWVWSYLALYLIGNIAISLCLPAWQSMMADMVPPETRGSYFGIRSAIAQATGVVVTLAAGWYLERHQGYAGFRGLYTLAAVAGLVNVSLFFFQPEAPYVRGKTGSLLRHIAMPLRSRGFRNTVLYGAALGAVTGLVNPFYAVYMIKGLGVGYATLGIASAVSTLGAVVANLLMGRYLDRIRMERYLTWAPLLFIAVPLVWLALRPASTALLFPANLLSGALMAVQQLVLTNLSYGMSPRDSRPVFLAVFSAVGGLAGFAAPILGGWLFEGAGFTVVLLLTAVAYAAVAALGRFLLAPWIQEQETLH